jgi:AcrR family transcriptional regulator
MTATRVPYAEAARNLLHQTVFGAVEELVRSRGWKATTMSDVAEAAGVSRQTLYNEFGSRQALVQAYVVHEVQKLIDEATDNVRAQADDPHAALESAFALFLKLASDEPFVQIVVSNTEGDSGEILQLVTAVAYPIGTAQVSALILELWPQASQQDADLVADTLVRLAVSHALYPHADAADVAGEVRRLIAPFVDIALKLR